MLGRDARAPATRDRRARPRAGGGGVRRRGEGGRHGRIGPPRPHRAPVRTRAALPPARAERGHRRRAPAPRPSVPPFAWRPLRCARGDLRRRPRRRRPGRDRCGGTAPPPRRLRPGRPLLISAAHLRSQRRGRGPRRPAPHAGRPVRGVGTAAVAPGDGVRAFLDGRRWRGDPRAIPLRRHASVVLEVGRHFTRRPTYLFPRGL